MRTSGQSVWSPDRKDTLSDYKLPKWGAGTTRSGTRKYAGEDLSDLNMLLMQLQSARPSADPQGGSGSGGTGGSTTVQK